jgi:hypothetical protein
MLTEMMTMTEPKCECDDDAFLPLYDVTAVAYTNSELLVTASTSICIDFEFIVCGKTWRQAEQRTISSN